MTFFNKLFGKPDDGPEPEFQTDPPLVIKIYYDYFHISGDGNSKNPDDHYNYNKIKSLFIKTGALNVKGTIGLFTLNAVFNSHHHGLVHESDELIIEAKDGKSETRYLNGADQKQISEAIELIKDRLTT